MPDGGSLSSLAFFGLGCVGGMITFLVSFALPELRSLVKQNALGPPHLWQVVVIALLALTLVALGGGAALLFGTDGTSVREAVINGVAAEGLIAGAVKTVAQ